MELEQRLVTLLPVAVSSYARFAIKFGRFNWQPFAVYFPKVNDYYIVLPIYLSRWTPIVTVKI